MGLSWVAIGAILAASLIAFAIGFGAGLEKGRREGMEKALLDDENDNQRKGRASPEDMS